LRTVLATDDKNRLQTDKSLVEKVAEGRALSEDERGQIETRIADETVKQSVTEVVTAARKGGRRKGQKCGNGRGAAHDLAIQARRRLVFQHRSHHPATPVRKIAKLLGCAVVTVMKDIQALRVQHAEVFSPLANIDMVGKTLEQYDILAGTSLRLAEAYTTPHNKSVMFRAATQALVAKTNLMLDTGIISKAALRHQHSGPGGSPIPMAVTVNEPTVAEKAAALMASLAAEQIVPRQDKPANGDPSLTPKVNEGQSGHEGATRLPASGGTGAPAVMPNLPQRGDAPIPSAPPAKR
jgi:hypothetical protein